MTLAEMIFCRRSCRSFTGLPADGAVPEKIRAFPMKPLYPDIRFRRGGAPTALPGCTYIGSVSL